MADEAKSEANPFRNFGIQDCLSLGYLYLLCVGMLTDIIYYQWLDINILHFTSVFDVLLSPIIFVVKRPVIIFILVGIAIAVKFLHQRAKAKDATKKVDLDAGHKSKSGLGLKIEIPSNHLFGPLVMGLTILFLFVGGGMGAGVRVSQRISKGGFERPHKIVFNDAETVQVYIVGQNSDFVFYVTKGSNHVTVAPVRGNIKLIGRYEQGDSDDEEDNSEQTVNDENQASQSKPKTTTKQD